MHKQQHPPDNLAPASPLSLTPPPLSSSYLALRHGQLRHSDSDSNNEALSGLLLTFSQNEFRQFIEHSWPRVHYAKMMIRTSLMMIVQMMLMIMMIVLLLLLLLLMSSKARSVTVGVWQGAQGS